MDRIDGMRTFVAVVESGSFSAAAKRLGISNKLVSKYIATLEEQVGSTLLFRTTRSMSISSEGKIYLEGCRRVLTELNALDTVFEDTKGLRGVLRVAAPVTFGEVLVTDAVVAFMGDHPDVEVDLVLSDAHEDLAEKGFDLAIRIGELKDSNLRARKLGETTLSVIASPDYLSRRGVPRHPDDLANHICIRNTNGENPNRWPFEIDGAAMTVPITGPFVCNSSSAGRIAAVRGLGLAMLPDLFAQKELGQGALVQVLQDHASLSVPVQAVYLPSQFQRPKVAAFVDHMKTFVANSKAKCDAAKIAAE